jgi:hypothetical protein
MAPLSSEFPRRLRDERRWRDDERNEHKQEGRVSKRCCECHRCVRGHARGDHGERQVREVERAAQPKSANGCEREEDEEDAEDDHGRVSVGRLRVDGAAVNESAAPSGQRQAESGVAGGKPGAELDPRVGPPNQRRDHGCREAGGTTRAALQQLPNNDCEQDDDERLLRQGQKREADPRWCAPTDDQSCEGPEHERRRQRLAQVDSGRGDESRIERDEQSFPAGPAATESERRGRHRRDEQRCQADDRESGGRRLRAARAQKPAEPSVERVPVPVRGLVEQVVDVPGRERIDGDSPIELAVVGAPVDCVKAWIERSGGGSQVRRRVDVRQDGQIPTRRRSVGTITATASSTASNPHASTRATGDRHQGITARC